MKRDLFRRPTAWIIFVALSVGAIIYIYNNFNKANSLINVDISMDRELALKKAKSLAEQFSLGPEEFKQPV